MTLRSPRPLARRRRAPWGPVLVAVALVGCGGGRAPRRSSPEPPASSSPRTAEPWFTDLTADVGLEFTYVTGAAGKLHMPESVSGGCALFDADGDGDLDIYLANGNWLLPDPADAADPVNAFFRQGPDGRFVEATEESGLGDGGYGMGLGTADFDNDGDLDVYVANYGADRLYRNRGDGTFEDVSAQVGVDVPRWSSSVAFLDYDRDGWLDLYVTQYVDFDPAATCQDSAGRIDYCGPRVFEPLSDVLLRGAGDGTFQDVSEAAGITGAAGASLGAICGDFDRDGWVDVYVSNDGWDNHLWMNQGDGTFRNEALVRGAAYNMQGLAEAGMGLVADDLDGDGHEDLFITHLTGETNTFLRNLGGRGVFDDRTGRTALGAPSMQYTGFGVVALDLDLDTDLDLVVANGAVRRGNPPPGADLSLGLWAELAQANQIFLNDGAGVFEAAKPATSGLLERADVSRGLATGDIDGDGDLDLLVTNLEGPTLLYRNDAPSSGHWLQVRAVLPERKRDAIGARVTVRIGERSLYRTIRSGLSFQSSSQLVAHFGLGAATVVDHLDVHWPDGQDERFPGTAADRVVTLRRGEGEALP